MKEWKERAAADRERTAGHVSEPHEIRTRLGIVGHAADKFTTATEAMARQVIRDLIAEYKPDKVVSGHCPIGGVDIWAEEEADKLGVEKLIFPPKTNNWLDGFRPRNIQIYENSDVCACVVVSVLPGDYRGRVFEDCYHCKGRNPPHVKSGGCWTTWRCKVGIWRIVADDLDEGRGPLKR